MLYRMEKEMPSWRDCIAKGNFLEVKRWLKTNVHLYGSLYDPLDMLAKITGEGINPQRFIDYLDSKYAKLYGF
jgi:carboxypeptidase Taq